MEVTDLVRIRGSPMEVLGTVLDTLVRSRLVIEEERGAELAYEVAHPLIAETIYQSIGRARRRALHRTVGQGLLAAGRLSEAAPHFTRAGDIGDPEAVSALTAALRLAEEREAFREALTLTGSLAELLPPGDDRWVAVADALAWPAEWVVDHRADVHTVMAVPALRAMDAVLEGHPEPGRQAKVKFRLTSFLNWGTGELEEAERHCQAALEFFEAAGDTRSMLLTANEAAWARCLRGDYRGFELSAAEVVERARRAGERGVELQAIIAQGFGALWGGRLEAARALSEESHRLASETGNVYRLPYTLAARAWVADRKSVV